MNGAAPPPDGPDQRVVPFPEPQRLLDPAALPADLLRRLGPPDQTDADRARLSRVLGQVAAGQFRIEPFVPGPAPVPVPPDRVRQLLLRTALPSRTETSRNWSGAYITANESKRFLLVLGSWVIPDKLKLPPPEFRGPPNVEYRVANWIGLDGQRLYFDSSLPQMGTASILQPDGTTRSEAWVQWFEQGSDDPNLTCLTLALQPGQPVLCLLVVLGPQEVACLIANLAGPVPVLQAVSVKAPPIKLPNNTVAVPDIAGATAEWIVERPQVIGKSTLNGFPDYGETEFEACLAVEGRGTGLASLPGGTVQDLSGSRPIRMYDRLQGPSRTRYTSMPHKVDGTTLRVRYGGFRQGGMACM